MNKQSSLYQELNHAELLSIMASVFPQEKVTDYHLLSGGLFNTTYRVITDQRDVVLRMGPVHRELLLPYERDLMTAEALTNQLCRENGTVQWTVPFVEIRELASDLPASVPGAGRHRE